VVHGRPRSRPFDDDSETPGLLTFTISIIVFFVGAGLNHWIAPLRRWNIPEAVTGGLLAVLVRSPRISCWVSRSFSTDEIDKPLCLSTCYIFRARAIPWRRTEPRLGAPSGRLIIPADGGAG
jgi:Sodium/glutamate symporter